MKRFRLALLLFPMVLGALAWGLKWRADNPSSTKEDLRIRALMSQLPGVVVEYYSRAGDEYYMIYQNEEAKLFVDSFHLMKGKNAAKELKVSYDRMISFKWVVRGKMENRYASFYVDMNMDDKQGKIHIARPEQIEEYDLHPATVKRWRDILFNHPQHGPELRRRMKP